MTKSKQGSGKRQLQERKFEIVVNHITINEDQLPQVSRESVTALKRVFGHNIKKCSGTFHHKPRNDHVHFFVVSEAPKTKSVCCYLHGTHLWHRNWVCGGQDVQ